MTDQDADKLEEQSEEEQPSGESPAETEFATAMAITRYLRANGWKIGKSSVSSHIKQGKLRPDIEGKRFSTKGVLKYASSFLTMEKTRRKVEDEALQRQNLKYKTLREEEQWRTERLKRLALEGRYILRSDFGRELSARGLVLDAELKFMIQERAGELIELVKGDHSRAADLIRAFNESLDRTLHRFSTMKEFQVLVEKPITEEDLTQSRGDAEKGETDGR